MNRANICSHFPGWYFSHFKINQKGPWCLFSRGLPQLPKHFYNTQYFSILVPNISNFETPFTKFLQTSQAEERGIHFPGCQLSIVGQHTLTIKEIQKCPGKDGVSFSHSLYLNLFSLFYDALAFLEFKLSVSQSVTAV